MVQSGDHPRSWCRSSAGRGNVRFLEVKDCEVKYTGPGTEDGDAAAVRSNKSINRKCGLYYYEAEIVSRGRDGFIGIGFATAEVKLDRLPGWELKSYGYHGDDGFAFSCCGTGRAYGPQYTSGDVIGCLLNKGERTISFFKNGMALGVAFADVTSDPLYPCVGLRTPDEHVVANFGERPFRADFGAMEAEARRLLQRQIAATPVPEGAQGCLTGQLVFDYLLHHGFWKTAEVVGREAFGGTRTVPPALVAERQEREEIARQAAEGRLEEAIAAAAALGLGQGPGREETAAVLFRVKVQHFIELVGALIGILGPGLVKVRRRQQVEAIQYARSVLSPLTVTRGDRALVEDALTLLAYSAPEESKEVRHLYAPARRQEVAQALLRCLLVEAGCSQHSPLERAALQLKVLGEELRTREDPLALTLDWDAWWEGLGSPVAAKPLKSPFLDIHM